MSKDNTIVPTPEWLVEPDGFDRPVVAQINYVPETEALPVRERQKAKKGEPYRFPLDVIIEPTSLTQKRAKILGPSPGSAHFEVFSDEGKMLGGVETAPTPLAYFTAGVGFCLLTHITGYLQHSDLKVKRLRIEMRALYHTTLGHVSRGNQGLGGCDGFETYVIIDSDETTENLQALLVVCEEACIASQTIVQAIPSQVSLVLNGALVGSD